MCSLTSPLQFLSSLFDGHDEDGALEHDDATSDGYTIKANGGDVALKDAKIMSRQIPIWLSDSTPDEFVVCLI